MMTHDWLTGARAFRRLLVDRLVIRDDRFASHLLNEPWRSPDGFPANRLSTLVSPSSILPVDAKKHFGLSVLNHMDLTTSIFWSSDWTWFVADANAGFRLYELSILRDKNLAAS